jgi:hypothetical protein
MFKYYFSSMEQMAHASYRLDSCVDRKGGGEIKDEERIILGAAKY